MSKFLFLLIIVSFEFSCVSISRKEVDYNAQKINESSFNEQNAHIFLINENGQKCISEDQRKLILDSLKKYYNLNLDDKVSVYIREKFNNSLSFAIVNISIAAISNTIIPVYLSTSFEIDVYVTGVGDSLAHQSYIVHDEGLISILALPFMFTRSLHSVRSNNIENGFYLASKAPTDADNTKVKLYSNRAPASICTSFRDSQQKW